MRSLRQFLGLEGVPDPARDSATVRRIAAELDRLEPGRARYLASFGYVLARIAHADFDVSAAEVREMERIVAEAGELDAAQAALVVQIARSQAQILAGTENYVVTRQYRELSTREQRLGLVRCLFAVAAAEGGVSSRENAEISQIATELAITAEEVTALRSEFRDQLSFLKPSRS